MRACPGLRGWSTGSRPSRLPAGAAADRELPDDAPPAKEFELDDPGNTTLIARLLSQLVERDVSVAATSNTLSAAVTA